MASIKAFFHKLKQWSPLILSIGLSTAAAVYIASHVNALESLMIRIGFLGPLISIVLQTILGASPIPTEPLTMINGAVFGPLAGAFYSWVGYMLASMIEYFIGARIGVTTNFDDQREKLPFGLGRFPVDSAWFLLAARMVPGYGSKMVGIMGGMYRVPLWRFIWTSAIPHAIGALAAAFVGVGLKTFL
jgi:uncharacterized membrane protein YdjX (TVP38/TMEM64 family)